MDFFREFSKQFSSVARSVAEKSKENPEAARAEGELRAARAALEQLYCRYGKACYALQNGRGNRDEAAELALRIRAGELEAAELETKYGAARELKRCLSCGAVHPKEARYCSACGKRLPDEAPKPEPTEVGEYCPNCGAMREGGEAACPVCGASFEPVEAPQAKPAPESVCAGEDVEEPDDPIED